MAVATESAINFARVGSNVTGSCAVTVDFTSTVPSGLGVWIGVIVGFVPIGFEISKAKIASDMTEGTRGMIYLSITFLASMACNAPACIGGEYGTCV